MSIEVVSRELARFIQGSSSEALILRGLWGVGKTFLWQSLVEKASRDLNLGCEYYAYVSLFGVADLEALKNSILISRVKSSDIASRQGKSFNPREILKNVEKLPKVREWTGGLASSLAFLGIRDTLICFDDLERRGEGFDFREIFGLMSILKEHRNCRIVIIANEDTLDEASLVNFRRNSEKLVDINLELVQNPENAFNCVFLPQTPHRSLLHEFCLSLEIVNIRILQRLQRFMNGLAALLRETEEDVVRNVLSSLVLFVWCFYDKSDTAPTFEYLKDLNINRFIKMDQQSESEKEWNRLLREYGYRYTDEMDSLLASYIERGYLDEEAMRTEIEERNQNSKERAGQQYFRKAWDIYLDSFDDNEEEFAKALVDGFRGNMVYLTLQELDQVAFVLRKIERGRVADQLIGDYFQLRSGDIAKLKSGTRLTYSPEDVRLAQLLAETLAAISDTRSLGDVIKHITASNGWSFEDEEILVGAEIEDYCTFFRTDRSRQLRSYVKRCLDFGRYAGPSQRHKLIATKAESALRMLATENRINRLRVEALYGVSLEGSDQSEEGEVPAGDHTSVAEESAEVEDDFPST